MPQQKNPKQVAFMLGFILLNCYKCTCGLYLPVRRLGKQRKHKSACEQDPSSSSFSSVAKLADSLRHSQFIPVFIPGSLFIYFAPNRPICWHHLPTQIVACATIPPRPPLHVCSLVPPPSHKASVTVESLDLRRGFQSAAERLHAEIFIFAVVRLHFAPWPEETTAAATVSFSAPHGG